MTARRSPAEILALSAEEADDLLDRLEAEVPSRPPLARIPSSPQVEAIVFGDTHGDWRSTEAIASRFLERSRERCLIGLGDYVDRAPDDCAEGSVANALYLLELAAEFPLQVYLVQGNHETVRSVAALPHELPEEIDQLWGPDPERYERLVGLLERGPLAAITESGAYLAHGGFPRGPPGDWETRLGSGSIETILDVAWSDVAASRIHRGLDAPFPEAEVAKFLQRCGCRIFLRGHDPDVTGLPLYHDRVLTLHSTRFYEQYGGVLYAHLPLTTPVQTVRDVRVEHASTQGRLYPEP